MRFAYLADHMHYAPRLASAHVAEWSALIPNWHEPDALAELQTHTGKRAIPTTLLALAHDPADGDDCLLGSVSLLANDHEQIRAYSPWLASLYVWPAFRGQGHGIALVQRCVEEARALGIKQLFLYTAAQQDFYRKLGWTEVTRMRLGVEDISVMGIRP